MQHNLTEASELVGINRTTIWRHIKRGLVSASMDSLGKSTIETSELIRVYGQKPKLMQNLKTHDARNCNASESPQDLDQVKAAVAAAIEPLQKQIDQLQQQLMRLELKPTPEPETKPEQSIQLEPKTETADSPKKHWASDIMQALRESSRQ